MLVRANVIPQNPNLAHAAFLKQEGGQVVDGQELDQAPSPTPAATANTASQQTYRVPLLADGHSCYCTRRSGERKCKSIRGYIVNPNLAILSLLIDKQDEGEIPRLTDNVLPKRLGPRVRPENLFNLGKEEDVRKFVVRREERREALHEALVPCR